jgi:hypothetical protein
MRCLAAVVVLTTASGCMAWAQPNEEYLGWSTDQARKVAESARVTGQVGKTLDFRILSTDRSFNYKLRATWMTSDVIRANARLLQISQRLSSEQTRALVSEAETVGDTVVMVELDPREGSGVIPRDWLPVLQPKDAIPRGVAGIDTPKLREIKALSGALRRDYNYDVFWVVFPLKGADGHALFEPGDREAELVVRIYEKEGKVRWPIPNSVRKLK